MAAPERAQTYSHPAALASIRAGRCPECDGTPESHGNDPRFWMPGNQSCSLREDGVRDRIAYQLHLDKKE